MRRVTLELAGYKFEPEIRIDGKLIKAKKNKDKRYVYIIETEKEELDLDIYKWYEEESDYWLVASLIFYVITIFGIFDIKKDKNCRSLKYKGKLLLPEDKEYHAKIVMAEYIPNQLAFGVAGDQVIEDNDSNKYFDDEVVLSRRKSAKKIKKILTIATILAFGLGVAIIL